ncbi:hypothetical protein C8Q73DRAFT_281363 [Cubamyces lactineus]|nr:hypothetical protein C8Q73DRAFT_281363 [Cubamyces lactineus]
MSNSTGSNSKTPAASTMPHSNTRTYTTDTADTSFSESQMPGGLYFPWRPRTLEDIWEKRGSRYTAEEKAEAWSGTAEVVKTYSDEMVQRMNKEIDTLLVYAGLFSAILTAFNVQSYPLLQPAPPDPTLAALFQISAQLSSFSINPPFVNSTAPAFPQTLAGVSTRSASPPPAWAVWLNVFWFSSLICSLAAASIGITVKQWLNHYALWLSGASRDVARLRQFRLNGLRRWHVESIVAVLPVLLQLALGLFSAGLLVLLWNLHQTVAVVVACLVGVLFVFTTATSVLPAFRADCSYISPQAIAVFWLYVRWVQLFQWTLSRLVIPLTLKLVRCIPTQRSHSASPSASSSSTSKPTSKPPRSWTEPLQAVRTRLTPPKPTWRGREQAALSAQLGLLDASMLAHAYHASFDPTCLDRAGVCMLDLAPAELAHYTRTLRACVVKHTPECAGPPGWLTVLRTRPQFWCSFLLPLLMDLSSSVDARESVSGQELETTTRCMLPLWDDVPAEQVIAHALGFVAPDLPSSPYTFFFPFRSSTDPRLYPRLLEWSVELYAAVATTIPGSRLGAHAVRAVHEAQYMWTFHHRRTQLSVLAVKLGASFPLLCDPFSYAYSSRVGPTSVSAVIVDEVRRCDVHIHRDSSNLAPSSPRSLNTSPNPMTNTRSSALDAYLKAAHNLCEVTAWTARCNLDERLIRAQRACVSTVFATLARVLHVPPRDHTSPRNVNAGEPKSDSENGARNTNTNPSPSFPDIDNIAPNPEVFEPPLAGVRPSTLTSLLQLLVRNAHRLPPVPAELLDALEACVAACPRDVPTSTPASPVSPTKDCEPGSDGDGEDTGV